MKNKNLHLSWPHLALGAIGLALSAYAWHEHLVIKAGNESGCYVSETINCESVLSSKYAELVGIPLGVFGMVYFAVVLMTAISTEADFSPRRFALTQLAVSLVGIATATVLIYISKVIIGAFCPICMATHATTSLLFLFSLRACFRARKLEKGMAAAQNAL